MDCCTERSIYCDDSKSLVARSGLRILDETSRSMYLLGVQEWSATTGLPVRHPLFFTWVIDPVSYPQELISTSDDVFWARLCYCFFVSLVFAFVLHIVLQ